MAAENAFRALSGGLKGENFVVESVGTPRFVDSLSIGEGGKIAVEVKTGYTTATGFVKAQVAKDAALLESGAVQHVVWVVKGKISKPLKDLLDSHKIEWHESGT